MEFGYWGIKGAGEPIRWLIAYLGLEVAEYNPVSREAWVERKATLGPFPNLPFLKDGDFFLSETSAIPYYLIEKSGKTELLGKTTEDKARILQIQGFLLDVRQALTKSFFAPGDHKASIGKVTTETVVPKFQLLEALLGDKDFLLGYLTWADFQFAFTAQFFSAGIRSVGLECPLATTPKLKALVARVVALPGVSARYEASKSVPYMPPGMLPFNIHTTAELDAQS